MRGELDILGFDPANRVWAMVGVVIVSYHSDDRTVRFVTCELSKLTVPYTVVVVNNGATEAEAAALGARLPGVTVIASDNGGYAKGNNLGARWLREHVHPSHILFTNDDVVINSDRVVESLVICASENPSIGAVGPEVVGPDGVRQSPEPYMGLWSRYVWMYFSTPFLSRQRKRECFGLDYPEKAGEGAHYKLSGSFFLVDADAFFEAGMFDEHTFLYAEENILSERFSRIGRCCWFLPSVRVLHEHGKTIDNHIRKRAQALLQYDSMAYYYTRYRGYSRFETWLVRCLFRFTLLLK